jgi:hypothetical protein
VKIMKKSTKILAILGLAAAAAAGPAMAQEQGLYLGGSVGHAEVKDTCEGVTGIAAACRDHDTAWRVFSGYRFSRHVSAELGFTNLGDVSAVTPTGSVLDAENKGVDGSAIFSIPLTGGLSALVRLGVYRMRTTVEFAGSRSGDTSSGFTYGLGAAYDLWRLGLRLEWQRYDSVGGPTTGEDTIDVFSVGALFRF